MNKWILYDVLVIGDEQRFKVGYGIPVTNTEPFKGKFPERDVTGASVIQVRPPRVSDDVCLASRKSSPPSPRPRRRPIRIVGENIFSAAPL